MTQFLSHFNYQHLVGLNSTQVRDERPHYNAGFEFQKWHRACTMFGLASAIAFHTAVQPIDMIQYPIASALAILAFGVPHGALDIEIGKRRYNLQGRATARLLAAYVLLTVTVIVAWTIASSVCLASFLIISAYHFGGIWPMGASRLGRLAAGAAVLAAPTLTHTSEVIGIFAWLVPQDAAVQIAMAMSRAAAPATALALVLGAASLRSLGALAEWAIAVAAASLLPPLTFFLLYFCFCHSVRHVAATAIELGDRPGRPLVAAGLPYATLAICGCLVGAFAFSNLDVGPALVSSVFVGLAAMTVPHMLLIDGTG